MKINEILDPSRINTDIKNVDETFDDVVIPYIKIHCSEFLNETNSLMFRGLPFDTPNIFVAESRSNRTPKDIGKHFQEAIDNKLKESGFTALRSNSIFCTGNQGQALNYGQKYCIFPLNGFTYTWCSAKDLFIDYLLTDGVWSEIQRLLEEYSSGKLVTFDDFEQLCIFHRLKYSSHDLVTAYKYYFNLHTLSFIKRYNFSKLDLNVAIMYGNEIYIHGKYIGVQYNIVNQSKYFNKEDQILVSL